VNPFIVFIYTKPEGPIPPMDFGPKRYRQAPTVAVIHEKIGIFPEGRVISLTASIT